MTIIDPVALSSATWPVARRMRWLREEAGLDQATMAARFHISRATVSGWENGATEPRFSQMVQWAHMTGGDIEWLAAGVNDEAPAEAGAGVVRSKGLEPPTFWLGGTSPLTLSGLSNALDLILWDAELEEAWERALREWEERIGLRDSEADR